MKLTLSMGDIVTRETPIREFYCSCICRAAAFCEPKLSICFIVLYFKLPYTSPARSLTLGETISFALRACARW